LLGGKLLRVLEHFLLLELLLEVVAVLTLLNLFLGAICDGHLLALLVASSLFLERWGLMVANGLFNCFIKFLFETLVCLGLVKQIMDLLQCLVILVVNAVVVDVSGFVLANSVWLIGRVLRLL
jgi:hypothetical protein